MLSVVRQLASPPDPVRQPESETVSATGAGWRGELALDVDHARDRSRIERYRHRGPLLVQRPFYPEGGSPCHLYLLHPPAGLVGGDSLAIDMHVKPAAHALVTTPAATKIYRSAGATARVQQRLHVAGQASLEWLPQETIVFNGALARIETVVDIAAGGRFIGWDIHCLGRPAAAETFTHGRLDSRFSLIHDFEPQLLDRLVLRGGDRALQNAAGLRGHAVNAVLVAVPGTAGMLELARTAIEAVNDALHAITCVDGVIVCRVLAHGVAAAWRVLVAVWTALRLAIIGRPACLPRIWAT